MTPTTSAASAATYLVPPTDEFGLPAWIWLIQILLPFTFLLHVIFMNYALGASLITPILWGIGRKRQSEPHLQLARTMIKVWPVAISFTITTGVAPLLFVQVLYGHFFYTANILLGWRWLAMLGILIVGFYSVYLLDAATRTGRAPRSFALLFIIALAFLWIAHEFTNNSVLMLLPQLWRDMFDGNINKHARHPMWSPRYMHSLIGAIAVTGLWMAGIGRLARSLTDDAKRLAIVTGLKIAAIATGLQILTGVWFLLALGLSSSTFKALMNFATPGPWLWAPAVIVGIMAITFIWMRAQDPDNPKSVWLSIAVITFVLIGMVAGREIIRIDMLAKTPGVFYEPADVRLQITPLILFAVSLLLGIGIITLMIRWIYTARPPAEKS